MDATAPTACGKQPDRSASREDVTIHGKPPCRRFYEMPSERRRTVLSTNRSRADSVGCRGAASPFVKCVAF